jgi:hypothetical protein
MSITLLAPVAGQAVDQSLLFQWSGTGDATPVTAQALVNGVWVGLASTIGSRSLYARIPTLPTGTNTVRLTDGVSSASVQVDVQFSSPRFNTEFQAAGWGSATVEQEASYLWHTFGLPAGAYTLQVRSVDKGVPGPWSSVLVDVRSHYFQGGGAQTYDVEWQSGGDSVRVLDDTHAVSLLWTSRSIPAAAATLLRVRARDRGTPGPWAETYVIGNGNGIQGPAPNFRYEAQAYISGGWTDVWSHSEGLNFLWTTKALPAGQTMLRLRAWNLGNLDLGPSFWSASVGFQVPAGAAAAAWEGVWEADGYPESQLFAPQGPTSYLWNTAPITLAANARIGVRAVLADGSTGPWGYSGLFTIDNRFTGPAPDRPGSNEVPDANQVIWEVESHAILQWLGGNAPADVYNRLDLTLERSDFERWIAHQDMGASGILANQLMDWNDVMTWKS